MSQVRVLSPRPAIIYTDGCPRGLRSLSRKQVGGNIPKVRILRHPPDKYLDSKGGGRMEAYCVKCKKKVEMQNPTDAVTKNGRKMKKGICPICGTKVNKFVSSK